MKQKIAIGFIIVLMISGIYFSGKKPVSQKYKVVCYFKYKALPDTLIYNSYLKELLLFPNGVLYKGRGVYKTPVATDVSHVKYLP